MTKKGRQTWNDNFKKWNGFDQNLDTFIVVGNTYEIKDELKAKGAKFVRELSTWVFDHEEPGYTLEKVNFIEVGDVNFDGIFYLDDAMCQRKMAEIRKKHEVIKPTDSEWVGEINGNYKDMLILKRIYFFEGRFGTTAIMNFKDPKGNTIVWMASRDKVIDMETEHRYLITAKIKDHSEYKGDKQTLLKRATVVADFGDEGRKGA